MLISASVIICDGCCCGRTEKGHNNVPVDKLEAAWQKYRLTDAVKLTISGCLGPCKMHNVAIIKTKLSKTWLGKLSNEIHYSAIIDWARGVANNSDYSLPNSLLDKQFIRD